MFNRSAFAIGALLTILASAPALAQQSAPTQRDYCPDRPGLGTPACIIAPGKVSIETGIADWTREDTSDEREDTLLLGDTLIRVGLGDALEAQIGWTPFGHARTRDKASGDVSKVDRAGDALIGLKANFSQPDGKGVSIAALPFATIPVGRSPIGAGDWGAGLIVPVNFQVSDAVSLQLSPEIDAAPDSDRHGRHLSYGGVVGLGLAVSKTVNLTAEFASTRDNDPEAHATQTYAALSTAWMASPNLQLDAGSTIGLSHDAADLEVYVGISRQL